MKNKNQSITRRFIAIACMVILFSACTKDDNRHMTYTIYTPVYKTKSTVLATINGSPSQAIEHAGKIYIKDNFIYLNEVDKGIHIIDNSTPARPVQIAFLAIPGNLDIAIKGNILYADMYGDLLAININNPRQAVVTSTINNFFTGRMYIKGHPSVVNDKVAVAWNEKDTTVIRDQNTGNCSFCQFDNVTLGTTSTATGTAGSMAGMVLMNDHLYAITEPHSVGIVDISNAATPRMDSEFFAGYDLQTIFPFQGKLFLGSAVGMFMYDMTNPTTPVTLGTFAHGRACDPVITDGHFAYVTLHAGDGCGGNANELHVIDVNDLQNTVLVKTYPMTKPTGLSKDGDLLFICDGTAVKLFNSINPSSLQLLKQINSNEPYDVITGNNRAMVVCADGLYQYDYSNINNIRLLSFLPAKR